MSLDEKIISLWLSLTEEEKREALETLKSKEATE